MIQVGCKGHAALRVTTENTARAMGSGELPVLATPAVAALVEKTCWQAIAPELELGMTTVGTSLQLAHTAPTPIGMVVQCDCEVLEVTDRRVRFGFRVYDDVTEVAGGEHERYLVDAERFWQYRGRGIKTWINKSRLPASGPGGGRCLRIQRSRLYHRRGHRGRRIASRRGNGPAGILWPVFGGRGRCGPMFPRT